MIWGRYRNKPVSSYEAAVCGSISGGIAAALTTPLDVLKTRLMLGSDSKGIPYSSVYDTLVRLYHEGSSQNVTDTTDKLNKGWTFKKSRFSYLKVFFAGIQPRVMWISIGGFFFFGAYEQSTHLLHHIL